MSRISFTLLIACMAVNAADHSDHRTRFSEGIGRLQSIIAGTSTTVDTSHNRDATIGLNMYLVLGKLVPDGPGAPPDADECRQRLVELQLFRDTFIKPDTDRGILAKMEQVRSLLIARIEEEKKSGP